MNEGKEIRSIIQDIDDIIKKTYLNEGYVFNDKPNPNQKPGGNLNPVREEPKPITNLEQEHPISDGQIENKSAGNEIDSEIVKIRQIALTLLANINPLKNPEQSKVVKTIWDACDKFLTKDNQAIKTKNENNNI